MGVGSPQPRRTEQQSHARPRPAAPRLAAYAAVVAGAVLMFLGWYGASGRAIVAQQIPYLASASIPGLALVVAGAVLISADRDRRSNDRAAAMVASLYDLLTEPVEADGPVPATSPGAAGPGTPDDPGATGTDEQIVSVAHGTRYHRPGCVLVDGKPGVRTVDAGRIGDDDLQPCPICEPVVPAP